MWAGCGHIWGNGPTPLIRTEVCFEVKKELKWEKGRAVEGQVVEGLGRQTNEFGHDSRDVTAH